MRAPIWCVIQTLPTAWWLAPFLTPFPARRLGSVSTKPLPPGHRQPVRIMGHCFSAHLGCKEWLFEFKPNPVLSHVKVCEGTHTFLLSEWRLSSTRAAVRHASCQQTPPLKGFIKKSLFCARGSEWGIRHDMLHCESRIKPMCGLTLICSAPLQHGVLHHW